MSQRIVPEKDLEEETQDIHGLPGDWGRVYGMSLAPLCLVRGFP